MSSSLLLVLIGVGAAPAFAREDVSALIQIDLSAGAIRLDPLGSVESLDGKCFETSIGRTAWVSTPYTVVWSLGSQCSILGVDPAVPYPRAWIHAMGTKSRFNPMNALDGELVHEYFAAEMDKEFFADHGELRIGDCYPVPVPAKDVKVYSWKIANKRRGGHCPDPATKVNASSMEPVDHPRTFALLETDMDPVFTFGTGFAAEGPSQAQLASSGLGDVAALNGKCFEATATGRVATVADSDVVVWDPQSPCPAGQSWIHYAGTAFQPMVVGIGEKTHHFFAAKVANAGDYEPFVGDCYDTPKPVDETSKSMWLIVNTARGGKCK